MRKHKRLLHSQGHLLPHNHSSFDRTEVSNPVTSMTQAATIADEVDLDDILDQALDDLEQIDTALVVQEEPNLDDSVRLSPSALSTGLAMKPHELDPFMTEKEDGADSKRDAQLLDQFMKQMQSAMNDSEMKANAKKPSSKKSPNRPATPNKNDTDNVEAALASILQQMTTMDPDEFDDDFLAATGGLNPDAIVDGMMEQLLSKDLMYEPMKHVADQFPAWLEGKEDTLSQAELAK